MVKKTTPKNTSKTKPKKKAKRRITKGHAYVKSSYNNTVISFTDLNGNILVWSSAGSLGFKGAKKSTPYAAQIVAQDVAEKIKPFGLQEIEVFVKGVGGGRESAIRALGNLGFSINAISDTTPIPHNGCRPRKPRRI
jgi:small subunit ribosomal protein S11